MKLKNLAAPLFVGVALLGVVSTAAYAQEDEIVIFETLRPALYMNGGIGSNEQAYMRKAGKDFSLRLIFAARKDNEFVADVKLLIEDEHGPVFMLPAAGPMTNVMLPEGKYRIVASYRGVTEAHIVTIRGQNGADVLFHWTGTPKK
ncbi:MAG: hypothetical protein G3I10_01590 [Ferrovum sp.]|nr:hypothetical protein [Ferrovum sp.]